MMDLRWQDLVSVDSAGRLRCGIHVAALMVMSGAVAAAFSSWGRVRAEGHAARQHSLRRNRSGRDQALQPEEPDGRPRRVPGRLAELCCPRLAPRDDRGLRPWQDQAHVQSERRHGYQVRLSRQWHERVRLREVQEGAAPAILIRTTTTATMMTARATRSPSREPSSPPTASPSMSTRATRRPARRPFTCTLTVPRSSSRPRRRRSRTDRSSRTRMDRTRPTRRVMERSSTRTMPSSSRSARTVARACRVTRSRMRWASARRTSRRASKAPAVSIRSSGPSTARTTPPPMFRRWRPDGTRTASS